MRPSRNILTGLLTLMLGALIAVPSIAFAAQEDVAKATDAAHGAANVTLDAALASSSAEAFTEVNVSAEAESASIDGCSYAVQGFYRAQKGSDRAIDGAYRGYAYLNGDHDAYVNVVALPAGVVVHVPEAVADKFGLDLASENIQSCLKGYVIALDEASKGGYTAVSDDEPWYFTSAEEVVFGDVRIAFNQEYQAGRFYTSVIGLDGRSVIDDAALAAYQPDHADTFTLVSSADVVIAEEAAGLDAVGAFLSRIDPSPLWVTLKTTGMAIVIVFFLGLLAAWWSLRIPGRMQDLADTVFTIPMVLPPTVCGFLLLLALGNNTPVGQWFAEIGFPLVFSWPATVIAATVVSFPLMYRSARGAFENLDPNMLDAARTLGWSEWRIFFKLMLPLAWSSIAAGTVLAYARALGEFGATLFMAGNYVGITRTIPIAIYYEWMGGNTDIAIFWTVVVLIFSFAVILFINLWSRRTTKYRRGLEE